MLLKLLPLFSILASFSGLISAFFGARNGLDQARTLNEKRFTIAMVTSFLSLVLVYIVVMLGLKSAASHYPNNAVAFSIVGHGVALAFGILYVILTCYMLQAQKRLRHREKQIHPDAFAKDQNEGFKKAKILKSKLSFLGLPIIHVQFSSAELNDKPVTGWIAIGAHARGGLFAFGGLAVAPIAIGIVSVGVFSIGTVGIGLFSLGTLAVGVIAFGSSAIGIKAYSAFSSLGWQSALSDGFSAAYYAAIGPFSFAKHVNNSQAEQISNLGAFIQHYQWILIASAFAILVPAIWYSKQVRKRIKRH